MRLNRIASYCVLGSMKVQWGLFLSTKESDEFYNPAPGHQFLQCLFGYDIIPRLFEIETLPHHDRL